ncbi:hypothetical protein CDL15_Pgr008628 [Punica granatum]|uniref:Uncharacterized protein n=1 Tax=Punica granatum TaxID=22663 RepID=A0A218XCS3_PUNGR|nr:hypothetical protein CDL15_Pgr008628 [Punica granatum]PKI62259.1 hypothetical protein CRG98_017339 [Punica granatum]
MMKMSRVAIFGLGALLLGSLLMEASITEGMGYNTFVRDSVLYSGESPTLSPNPREEAHIQGAGNPATEAVEESREDSSYEVIQSAPKPAPATSKHAPPVIETEVIVLGH